MENKFRVSVKKSRKILILNKYLEMIENFKCFQGTEVDTFEQRILLILTLKSIRKKKKCTFSFYKMGNK
jgi:hypothetical protein